MAMLRWATVMALGLGAVVAHGQERGDCMDENGRPRLCAYEPNSFGFTRDRDDDGFLDFKLSQRYELFPHWVESRFNDLEPDLGKRVDLYFAATVRLAQYIGSRDSSPVVGKRFNPKVFIRWWADDVRNGERRYDGYVDFAFLAHESNGQSINDPAELARAQEEARIAGDRPQTAYDRISRGWDYLEVSWKKRWPTQSDMQKLHSYASLKRFLSDGPFQGAPEEYNTWENDPEGKPRKQVHGVSALVKYVHSFGTWADWGLFNEFEDFKLAFGYETGYSKPFKHNTFRLEIGAYIAKLPINFWVQNGYGSDLALYYKRVSSYGVELQIGSF